MFHGPLAHSEVRLLSLALLVGFLKRIAVVACSGRFFACGVVCSKGLCLVNMGKNGYVPYQQVWNDNSLAIVLELLAAPL